MRVRAVALGKYLSLSGSSLSLLVAIGINGCGTEGEVGSVPDTQAGVSVLQPNEYTERFGEPLFRVGGADASGPLAFGRVSGVVIDSANRIWVGDDLASTIVRVSPDGQLVDVIGRRGQGPGEFLRVAVLGWHGTSVVVRGDNQDRLSFVDEVSGDVSQQRVERFWVDRPTIAVGVGAGGELVFLPLDGVQGLPPGEDPQRPQWIEYAPTRVMAGTSGGTEAIITAPVHAETYFDGTEYLRHPLMVSPVVRVGGDVAVLVGSLLGDIVMASIRTGAVRTVNMSEVPGVPLGSTAIARVQEVVDGLQPASRQFYASVAMVEAHGLPARRPFFDRASLSREAVLWVRHSERSGTGWRSWEVVTVEGRHLGTAYFRDGEDVVAASSSTVVTLSRDDLGAQVLSAYRHHFQ